MWRAAILAGNVHSSGIADFGVTVDSNHFIHAGEESNRENVQFHCPVGQRSLLYTVKFVSVIKWPVPSEIRK